MLPRIIVVEHLGDHRLRLRFDDGVEGEVDISEAVEFKGVLDALSDTEFFSRLKVDSEAGTIAWPNGVDLDPLVLHARITGKPIEFPSTTRQTG